MEDPGEEPPSVEPQDSVPLQVNVDDVKQCQAIDLTLARAQEQLGTEKVINRLASIIRLSYFTGDGDQRAQ